MQKSVHDFCIQIRRKAWFSPAPEINELELDDFAEPSVVRYNRVLQRVLHHPVNPLIAAFAVCLLLASCGTQGNVRVPTGVDLSGQWHLNEQQSESIDALLNSIKDVLDPPPRRRMAPPGSDESGRIFSRRDEYFGPPRTKEMIALLKLPAAFSLTQSPRSLTMKSIDGTTEYVFGESSVVSLPDGVGDRRCGWTGDQFFVRIQAVDGRKIEHMVGLSKDRSHLQVTTRVSGDGLPSVSLRRSFDRDEQG